MEVKVAFLLDDPACSRCGSFRRGAAVTARGRVLCPTCRASLPDLPARGSLQRLLRIRPRWGADGKSLVYERYEG